MIVEAVYDEVVEKVVELTRGLTIGLPERNFPIGPVIDESSCRKVLDYIEIGKQEGELLAGGAKPKWPARKGFISSRRFLPASAARLGLCKRRFLGRCWRSAKRRTGGKRSGCSTTPSSV